MTDLPLMSADEVQICHQPAAPNSRRRASSPWAAFRPRREAPLTEEGSGCFRCTETSQSGPGWVLLKPPQAPANADSPRSEGIKAVEVRSRA